MSGCKGADSGSPAPELIDVNSNRALRSLGRLSSSPAAGHRVPELQEQLNAMKRQLTEKEELIAILSGGRSRSRLDSQKGIFEPMVEIPVLREQLNHYRVASETARSELAALQVKYKSSQTELTDTCMKLASQEGYVQELKAEVERYKMENTRQQSLIVCLRERILESEEKSGTLLSSKTEAEVTLQVLQNENRELQQRNTELESKLRKYLTEWDEVKREDTRRVKEHDEFLEKLARAINVDSRGTEHHLDLLLSQVGDLYRENTRKIIQIRSLEETVGAHDMESKASRETIMRLVSELGREQKAVASYVQELGTIRKELDNALNSKHHLERENRSLQDRLDSTQRALEASKLETRSWEQRSKELDGSLLTSVCEAKSVHTQLEAFKHQLVSLLSKTDVIVPPTEEAIKERIHEVCNSEENSKQTVPQLEENVTKLTLQLEKQVDLHQAALQRCIKAEQELSELQEKVRFLEGNLLTGDVMCDTLSQDKQKLKAQKDELVSKELHMDLLRRKITQLDAEKQTQTALAVERDEANLTVRKLKKKVERLEKELVTARTSSLDLKAKLSDTQELKIKTLEQSKTIGELNKSMKKLEKLKETAVEKLNTTKSELDLTELEAKEEKERARNILEAVGSELKTLKQTLQEVARRERQLLDFREVVSRILGLNIDALALPDYEIVKRLEKLAQAHRTSAMTALCLENSMGKLHQGYLAGCEARQRLASSLNHPGCKPVPALPARRPKSSS
ncbi:coiled-coil domain-containing protein 170 isoform X2 [Stegostoma tigrinum]|uniref:coiled-coil domain-containing protein 170 isoform X2 n=1 Tax=Stegostoma tigrinum TaxID=3053191 RepID=UPI002870AADD|nr:coiled-coil domain-containing protein 170 isoform X2 [Stegostoma tigrinum]